MTTAAPERLHDEVFDHVEHVCAAHGLDALTARLVELRTWLASDLIEVEAGLAGAGRGDNLAERAVRHLLDQGGKRLRPICVALAAYSGKGFDERARTYAIAVELVHNATLLHDDVVDLGDLRRGLPAARVVYGNAASIFGGDWLLTDALCRIQMAGDTEVLARMLAVVKEMVIAESLQLARRGVVRADEAEYFRVLEGKTASLFRWAMFAGARAGGVSDSASAALEAYGQKLGVAFQLVDDALDFASDAAATGKSVLTDLREGKMTYPLILAMQRDPDLVPLLERACHVGAHDEGPIDAEIATRVAQTLARTGAVDDCTALANRLCREATRCLAELPPSRARAALESVALATPRRRK